MLGLILLIIGVAGFSLGAYWDIKTTEFPDWLPYSMIILALVVRGAFAFISGDFSIITNSIMIGALFLGFGLLLYYFKQWGDGDAWLLGAMGFLFPDPAGFVPLVASIMPFSMVIFFNFFIISLFYLIAYSVVLGLRQPKVFKSFKENLKMSVKKIALVFFALLAFAVTLTSYFFQTYGIPLHNFSGTLFIPFLAVLILIFFQYARAVEVDLFKKRISVKKLVEGDVLIKDRWRGITAEEVKKLQKKGGNVWIKEGVRFAPVFVICLLVTIYYGNLWDTLIAIF